MASRTENSIRNTVFALVSQGATLILSFITRTIFIRTLGAGYLGINGLFTNILSLLSFAELGFGSAIVFALYKPLAENDEKHISALMNFYEKVYRAVGVFIIVAGCCLIPFLDFFIGDTSEIPADLPPLWFVYILYLLNSAASYFFNYKRSLVTASQNGHIDSLNTLQFTLIRNVLQIILLIAFKAFIPYLVIQIACTFLGNVFISIKADKMFPYLKKNKKEKLQKTEFHSIMKNVIAMAGHKLGSVIVSGTDNILISKFVGIVATGYYSNYTLLTQTVRTIYVQVFTPVTASVGNLVASKSKDESYAFFKKLLFLNAYIAIFCTTGLTTLINPLIEILWGEEYVFDMVLVGFIMLNFFLTCMRQTTDIYINTTGLFWQIRLKPFFESAINLIASIVLAKTFNLGILGIVAGTTISTLSTNFWWEPYVVYKYAFDKNLIHYMVKYVQYILVTSISIVICEFLHQFFASDILGFILKSIITVTIPNVLILVFYHKTDEYKYVLYLAKNIINKMKNIKHR